MAVVVERKLVTEKKKRLEWKYLWKVRHLKNSKMKLLEN